MKLEIYTQVTNGNLTRNRPLLTKAIESLEGKNVTITIEKTKKKRSNNQNAFYWGVVVPLIRQGLNDLGHFYTNNQAHEIAKAHVSEFYPDVIVEEQFIPATKQTIKRIKSTSELTTSEFMDYAHVVGEFATDFLNITIPEPGEQMQLT